MGLTDLNLGVAIQELLARAEGKLLAESAGYAESGPTFDPSGDYLCKGCSFRLEPNQCAVVKGNISLETGGCIIYYHGEQKFQEPLPHQFPQEQVIYTERPNVKGFGCKRCEYQKDGHCKQWNIEVLPNACCFANEGEDDVVAPDMDAYGTSEGVKKEWDERGRGRRQKDFVQIERYTDQGEKGKFWGPKGSDYTDYGDVKSTAILDTSKIYKGTDSRSFIKKSGHWNDEILPEFRKKFPNLKTYKDIDDDGGADVALSENPNIYFKIFQDGAEKYLTEKGFKGAHWTDEDDLSPEQYQIWDDSVISDVRVHKPPKVKKQTKAFYGYGTSEGVKKEWDERGRGQKDVTIEGAISHWQESAAFIRKFANKIITGAMSTGIRGPSQEELERYETETKTILDAVRDAKPLDKAIYRGVSIWPQDVNLENSKKIMTLKEGDEFQMPELDSFSSERETARNFSIGTVPGDIHVVFEVAKGAKGVKVDDYVNSEERGYGGEDEVISNGRFKVTGVEDEKSSWSKTVFHTIHLEQLGTL